MLLDSLAESPYFDVLFQLLVSVVSDVWIFAKVLLNNIEYFWTQKVLPIPVSIPSGTGMGHTSTNTIKVLPILYWPYFLYSILTTLTIPLRQPLYWRSNHTYIHVDTKIHNVHTQMSASRQNWRRILTDLSDAPDRNNIIVVDRTFMPICFDLSLHRIRLIVNWTTSQASLHMHAYLSAVKKITRKPSYR